MLGRKDIAQPFEELYDRVVAVEHGNLTHIKIVADLAAQVRQLRAEVDRLKDALRDEGVRHAVADGNVTTSAELEHDRIAGDYATLLEGILEPLVDRLHPQPVRSAAGGHGSAHQAGAADLARDRARIMAVLTKHLFGAETEPITVNSTTAALSNEGYDVTRLDGSRLARAVQKATALRQRAADQAHPGVFDFDYEPKSLTAEDYLPWNRTDPQARTPLFLVAPAYRAPDTQLPLPQKPYFFVARSAH